jgi:ubiquinone/menaquinone biosynthesis C-methylase UbiE
MGLDWYDSSQIPFNSLLLLDRCQIGWFCSRNDFGPDTLAAFKANPHILWYFEHKNPSVKAWVEHVRTESRRLPTNGDVRNHEIKVLESMQDWIAYVWNPLLYDKQDFITQHQGDLLQTTDFNDKLILDVGSGTGRIALQAATLAKAVFACEPIENLREFIRSAVKQRGISNVYVTDGMIENLPFPGEMFDIVVGGYVVGDDIPAEARELHRVAKVGGTVILFPGNRDIDDERHQQLLIEGFSWEAYSETPTKRVRKYWKKKETGSG